MGYPLCTHCGSFQDWRRFLSVSAPILSLLVALVSVTGVMAPTISQLIWPNRAIINVGAAYEGERTVRLHFMNLGAIEGMVSDDLICADNRQNLLYFSNSQPSLVKGHEQVAASYDLNSTWMVKMLAELQNSPVPNDADLVQFTRNSRFECSLEASDVHGRLSSVGFQTPVLNLWLDTWADGKLHLGGAFTENGIN